MKKSLIDQDDFYRKTMLDCSVEERIQYCYELIDKNQNILTKQSSELPKLQKLILTELIEAAQKEVKDLITNNQTKKTE